MCPATFAKGTFVAAGERLFGFESSGLTSSSPDGTSTTIVAEGAIQFAATDGKQVAWIDGCSMFSTDIGRMPSYPWSPCIGFEEPTPSALAAERRGVWVGFSAGPRSAPFVAFYPWIGASTTRASLSSGDDGPRSLVVAGDRLLMVHENAVVALQDGSFRTLHAPTDARLDSGKSPSLVQTPGGLLLRETTFARGRPHVRLRTLDPFTGAVGAAYELDELVMDAASFADPTGLITAEEVWDERLERHWIEVRRHVHTGNSELLTRCEGDGGPRAIAVVAGRIVFATNDGVRSL